MSTLLLLELCFSETILDTLPEGGYQWMKILHAQWISQSRLVWGVETSSTCMSQLCELPMMVKIGFLKFLAESKLGETNDIQCINVYCKYMSWIIRNTNLDAADLQRHTPTRHIHMFLMAHSCHVLRTQARGWLTPWIRDLIWPWSSWMAQHANRKPWGSDPRLSWQGFSGLPSKSPMYAKV